MRGRIVRGGDEDQNSKVRRGGGRRSLLHCRENYETRDSKRRLRTNWRQEASSL